MIEQPYIKYTDIERALRTEFNALDTAKALRAIDQWCPPVMTSDFYIESINRFLIQLSINCRNDKFSLAELLEIAKKIEEEKQ